MTEFSETYWNELLEKYRNGSITENERFQLEKQALDDPFLFDALEGFSLYQDAHKKEKKTIKFFTLPRMAIAASLVLLVAVIFNLKSNLNTPIEEDQSMAMVLEKEDGVSSETDEIKNFDDSVQSQDESMSVDIEPVQAVSSMPSKSKKVVAAADKSDISVTSNNKAEVVEIIPPEPIVAVDTKSSEMVDADISLGGEIVEDKEEDELVVSDHKENVLGEVGVVNNEDNSVEVTNAANFETFEQKPKAEIVPLDSQSSKREEASENFLKKAKSLAYYKAVPVIGKEIFDDYAKQRIDERGLRQEKPQKVTIEFTIDENGNLTDFHHIFTGCPECGPFAITILQNSGEWKTVPPGYSGKARYTFIF